MKIALLNTMTPYVRGGAEILVDDLAEQLRLFGHDAEVFRLPFPSSFGSSLVRCISATQMLRFDDFDRVISFKFPAYCINHPNKVIWMFHQFRQVYELWDTDYGLKPSGEANTLRSIIKAVDDKHLAQCRHLFTNAREVSNRLMTYNGIISEVLHPPLKKSENYFFNKMGEYIFYPSRITELKRQHLIIDAMRYVKSNVKLIIAGRGERYYIEQLIEKIKKYKLEHTVKLMDGWISDEIKIDLLSNCLGVVYIPYKEDSCGFVTMEAFYSSKPVISCLDSGGTGEFIEDYVNGFLTEPTPEALAVAMDKLYENKEKAECMGKEALQNINNRNITWDETIRRLLK